MMMATIFIPWACYVISLQNKQHLQYYGCSDSIDETSEWDKIDEIDLESAKIEYDILKVNFEYLDNQYSYITKSHLFNFPLDIPIETHDWIKSAVVKYVFLDSADEVWYRQVHEEDCTNLCIKHAGPRGDFFKFTGNIFQFHWLFIDNSLYNKSYRCMLTINKEKFDECKIDVKNNTVIGHNINF